MSAFCPESQSLADTAAETGVEEEERERDRDREWVKRSEEEGDESEQEKIVLID